MKTRATWGVLLGLLLGGLLAGACGSGSNVSSCIQCVATGGVCSANPDGSFLCSHRPTPTPAPPTATPLPGATPTATPQAPPTPWPTATASPWPTPASTPCSPRQEKVCIVAGQEVALSRCNTCPSYTSYMTRYGYWTAGDPLEDGDVGGHPGMWINMEGARLAGLTRKSDCAKVNPGNGQAGEPCSACDPPIVTTILRTCPTPQPTPPPHATPTPGSGPTPTPGPGGCPALLRVGNSFLSTRPCDRRCVEQGYLGQIINWTSTELCEEGAPGCLCDPVRNRCEIPHGCQNPAGADIRLTLAGHFTNDLCDAASDNPFNCHHKPRANETGVTLFTSIPKGADPFDPRGVTNCADVQKAGIRPLDRTDPRCQAALQAAGR